MYVLSIVVSLEREIDLGDSLNLNIRRCKYVKPTPVQRYTIPISFAGRDLMACGQTGSGKTAAFCFPIISGIMRQQSVQKPCGTRTVFPLALFLSPTRERSSQIHVEARKFAYQTGVKVVFLPWRDWLLRDYKTGEILTKASSLRLINGEIS
ncbi:DEAD-box ATP-dependent RNA helicase 37 isoform X1 [Helianthus annuus]|uniref:DEAD-box ATP-dependent RNA helicase 37 isoform X1 n=2 Tax=Helianthus annuus TaxID=4232 RepID=UPI000B8FF6B5|nr:DEAD-box ATP-dependent RNA helicase 37 isoform X1 [Helianthus annuus]